MQSQYNMEHPEIICKEPRQKTTQPPIIFIHGMWHGAWCWEKYFMPYFAEKGYTSYAISLPGHGKSTGPKNFNFLRIKDYVDELKKIVDSLEVTPILIGHSMGGMIIQKYLQKYPCKAAVLITPVPSSGLMRISLKMMATKRYVIPSLMKCNLHGLVNTEKKVKWSFFNGSVKPEDLKEYSEKLSSESMLAFMGMLFPCIKIRYHKEIPMLVIAGGKDRMFTVREAGRTARKYGANLEVFDDLPHDMMLDKNHKEVADRIIGWLGKKVDLYVKGFVPPGLKVKG